MTTIQLLGKDDTRTDDSEMLAERWQAYVDSFVSVRLHEPAIDPCSINLNRSPESHHRWRTTGPRQASVPSEVRVHILCDSTITDSYFVRNIPASAMVSTPAVLARGALETRICIRTYRLFFVWDTEDFLWRIPSGHDADVVGEAASRRREAWLVRTRVGEWPVTSVKEPTPVPVSVSVPVSVATA